MRRGHRLALLAGASAAAYVGASWLLSRAVAHRLISSKALRPCRQPREDLIAALENHGALVHDFRYFGAARSPVSLAAVFATRGGPGSRPVIVFLHGKGGGAGEWTPDALRAIGAGYDVLVPDLRGHPPSGGEFVTFGLLECEDLARAVDAAKRFGLRPDTLALHCCSAGGTIGLEWAARDPRIRAIWLESPFADGREMAGHYLAIATGIPRVFLGLTTALAIRRSVRAVRRALALPVRGDGLERIDPLKAVGSVRVPVCLVHGRHDRLVPPHFAERLALSLPPGSTVWTPNAGHCHHEDQAETTNAEEYAARWTDFFDGALRRA